MENVWPALRSPHSIPDPLYTHTKSLTMLLLNLWQQLQTYGLPGCQKSHEFKGGVSVDRVCWIPGYGALLESCCSSRTNISYVNPHSPHVHSPSYQRWIQLLSIRRPIHHLDPVQEAKWVWQPIKNELHELSNTSLSNLAPPQLTHFVSPLLHTAPTHSTPFLHRSHSVTPLHLYSTQPHLGLFTQLHPYSTQPQVTYSFLSTFTQYRIVSLTPLHT